ncbi:hypothetical protein AB0I28_11450 [Phytomonospora sp. NPDC050363]|uniref:hypothetical protein n=1 Tax=Phytomonospora sp. NPDC050363 TaxID=3155642 RepID=UPI00340D88EA
MTLPDRLLSLAVRRWPAEIRAEQAAEWEAEMHAMGTDPGAGPLLRTLRRLRFAVSLAASPPVEDENGVPRGWREFLPARGRLLWPSLVLIGIGVAAGQVAFMLGQLAAFIGSIAFGEVEVYASAPQEGTARLAVGFALTVAGAFLAGWLGTAVSRRLALVAAPRTASRRVLATVGTVGLVALGAALAVALGGTPGWYDWAGLALWCAVCAAVSVGAVFIARGGRRWTARILGVAGGLVLLDLVAVDVGMRWAMTSIEGAPTPETYVPAEFLDMATAPVWFPLSLTQPHPFLFFPEDATFTGAIATSLSGTMTAYLLALVFLVGYTVRSARTARPIVVPARTATPAPAPGTPRRARLATLASAAAALGVWAYTVAFTSSEAESLPGDPEFMIWGFELRLASILLAMLSLAHALNGRARPLVPSLFGGTALLITDLVLDANVIPDPTAFAVALAVAAGVAWGVWWLALALAGGGPDAASARRGRVFIALLAAYAAPLVFLQMTWADTDEGGTPPALRLGTAIVCAALAALAMTAASAARVRPLSRVKAAILVVLPALLFAGIGLAGGTEATGSLMFAGSLAFPLLLVAFTVIRWDRTRRPALRIGLTVVALVPAVAVQILAVYLGIYLGMTLADPLLYAAGIGLPHDGIPMFVGAMLFGVPTAIVAARRTAPPPGNQPAEVKELTTV